MKIFGGMNINASAISSLRLRMDVISSNIANVDTTRSKFIDGKWEPYRRKLVITEESNSTIQNNRMDYDILNQNGVRVKEIIGSQEPFKQIYDPTHPDSDLNGMVLLPNVDVLKEMVDMISVTRSYEANVTAFNASKSMITKAFEIGR